MKKFTGAATISCAVIALASDRLRAPVERKRSRIGRRWRGRPRSRLRGRRTRSVAPAMRPSRRRTTTRLAWPARTKGKRAFRANADASGLATAHEGKTASDTMPKKLKKTEVPDDACRRCHYGAREELVAATVDVAVVDSKGTAVNPHDVTPSEQHDTIRCADCHGMHDAEKLADKADAECASCHHADVFECYTCHD